MSHNDVAARNIMLTGQFSNRSRPTAVLIDYEDCWTEDCPNDEGCLEDIENLGSVLQALIHSSELDSDSTRQTEQRRLDRLKAYCREMRTRVRREGFVLSALLSEMRNDELNPVVQWQRNQWDCVDERNILGTPTRRVTRSALRRAVGGE